MNSKNSSFWPKILPTHTFATAPELDVLLVPGGAGVRAPDVKNITDFIADRYPSLEYLITVCTGAGLAAKSGVLDGRRATTNKSAWSTVTAWGPNVNWIRQARWVVDGNIWTASGVSKFQSNNTLMTTRIDIDGSGHGRIGLDLCLYHRDVRVRAVSSHRDTDGVHSEHELEQRSVWSRPELDQLVIRR